MADNFGLWVENKKLFSDSRRHTSAALTVALKSLELVQDGKLVGVVARESLDYTFMALSDNTTVQEVSADKAMFLSACAKQILMIYGKDASILTTYQEACVKHLINMVKAAYPH